ncbi:MAG: Zn-ribbon domain-containing OB-fold protein [Candidatus Jordarchaeum sp.]|uniref:Zn-ribbon domain-containing OB-fold protein n=1 Tax=Candidatus Jordarchaeum sp. TaxID=2823881 RepID=UPI004049CE97
MRLPKVWREIPQKYRLEGAICRNCNFSFISPRTVCPSCGSRELSSQIFPQRGKVISYTNIWKPPYDFETYAPYPVALIELLNGIKIISQLTDCDTDEIFIGMPVEAVLRKLKEEGEDGVVYYAIKFRPLIRKENF